MKIIIVDDENATINRVSKILNTNFPDIEIVANAVDVKSAVEVINLHQPDLVLLDINLPDGTGFDVLQQLYPVNFRVIFITAYEHYAIKAFKFSAIDYILKPIDIDEFISSIHKAKELLKKENPNSQIDALISNYQTVNTEAKKIVLKTSESIHLVNIKDIIRLESDGAYTFFYFVEAPKIIVSKNIKEFEELLGDYGFFRTHQSHLINVKHLIKYQKSDGGYVIMKDQSTVPVSIRKKEQLMKMFEKM